MTAIDYTHLLIATVPEFVPSAKQVVAFLQLVNALNADSRNSPAILSLPSGTVSSANPFTGATLNLVRKHTREIADMRKLENLLPTLKEYDVQVNVQNRSDYFPIQVNREMDTGFGIRCVVKPQPERVLPDSKTSARFWIEFRLGKWTDPYLVDGQPVFNPKLLALVNETFKVDSRQAYYEG